MKTASEGFREDIMLIAKFLLVKTQATEELSKPNSSASLSTGVASVYLPHMSHPPQDSETSQMNCTRCPGLSHRSIRGSYVVPCRKQRTALVRQVILPVVFVEKLPAGARPSRHFPRLRADSTNIPDTLARGGTFSHESPHGPRRWNHRLCVCGGARRILRNKREERASWP